jgi:hypothetical protein
VLQYYRTALDSIDGNPGDGTLNLSNALNNSHSPSAELLFLIIANLNPEALENFHGSEIGDIDGNGLREFHDAWGNPIIFIRWAPAFTGSDLQPDVVVTSNYQLPFGSTGANAWNNPITISVANWNNGGPPPLIGNMVQANGNYPDPFDPDGHINRTWFVYPLIVSGGADGIIDLFAFDTNPTPPDSLPTFVSEISFPVSPPATRTTTILHPTRYPWGLPYDIKGDGVLNHYDNIHNHRSSGNSF